MGIEKWKFTGNGTDPANVIEEGFEILLDGWRQFWISLQAGDSALANFLAFGFGGLGIFKFAITGGCDRLGRNGIHRQLRLVIETIANNASQGCDRNHCQYRSRKLARRLPPGGRLPLAPMLFGIRPKIHMQIEKMRLIQTSTERRRFNRSQGAKQGGVGK